MRTSRHLGSEKLLREFVRGALSIVTEGPVSKENIAGTLENRQKHISAAEDFIGQNLAELEGILDDIEGPYVGDGFDRLEKVLEAAMQLDDKYQTSMSNDKDAHNFATAFTCYGIAEGDVHNIPFIAGKLADVFNARLTSSELHQSLFESYVRAAEDLEKIVDKSIEDMIPVVLRDDTSLAGNIAKNPERFDPSALAKYGNVSVDSAGRMTVARSGANLSFADAMRDGLMSSVKINTDSGPIALKDADNFLTSLDIEINNLKDSQSAKIEEHNLLDRSRPDFAQKSQSLNDEIGDIHQRLEDATNSYNSVEREQEELTKKINEKLGNKDYIISKIKEFSISKLSGPARLAAQYPTLTATGKFVADVAKTKVGRNVLAGGAAVLGSIGTALMAVIGAVLAAAAAATVGTAGYGLYELTDDEIARVDGAYSDFQNSSIDVVINMFTRASSSYYNFTQKLKTYKAGAQ